MLDRGPIEGIEGVRGSSDGDSPSYKETDGQFASAAAPEVK
jgi:hypothetical protein